MPPTDRPLMERPEYLQVSYDPGRVPFGPYPAQLAKHLVARFFPKPGRILDAGCGRGEFLAAFSAMGYSAAGQDISSAAAAFSPDLEIKIGRLGMGALPFPAETFDYALSKSVIEHLRDPVDFMAGIFAELKPGGVAVVMTPSWVHNAWGPFYIDHTHITPFTQPSLTQAMELAGFSDVATEHFYQLPALWKTPSLKLLSWLVAATPLPFRPFHPHAPWPDGLNKFIRFSNELMLLSVGRKPLAGKS